ncbi:hypothetical protein KEH51_17955 [[Brevibacterium] frigoritolerans]|uniref:Uncharacterized protein n=1 Tax=Peribacillus frigoritolerans TaxID=450367 RepID=A0A941J781_9BACI|nr:hypothetical protein [Peribacillus frigoritolerans]
MKRLLLFISFCFTLFIIYFDLTTGTLPASHPPASTGEPAVPASQPASAPSAAYKEITMQPGIPYSPSLKRKRQIQSPNRNDHL